MLPSLVQYAANTLGTAHVPVRATNPRVGTSLVFPHRHAATDGVGTQVYRHDPPDRHVGIARRKTPAMDTVVLRRTPGDGRHRDIRCRERSRRGKEEKIERGVTCARWTRIQRMCARGNAR